MKLGNKLLFVICAIAIVTGIIIYFEASSFQKSARITEGIIVNSDITYYYVQYTSDDGVERTFRGAQKKNGKRRENEKVKIFYQSDNPDKARVTDGVKGGRKVIIFSVLLLVVNIVSVYQDKSRNKSAVKFRESGRKMEAEILKIDKDTSITIKREHPYLIDTRWIDPFTGKEYTHTIKYVWKDPKTLLEGRNTIDVYIDRDNPDKYFMDIAFLGDIAR